MPNQDPYANANPDRLPLKHSALENMAHLPSCAYCHQPIRASQTWLLLVSGSDGEHPGFAVVAHLSCFRQPGGTR